MDSKNGLTSPTPYTGGGGVVPSVPNQIEGRRKSAPQFGVQGRKPDGTIKDIYIPQPSQLTAHECSTPNLLVWGPRGTGKSKWLRWDAILRCLMFPGFKALIIRRNMTDLKKSHLRFIGTEARLIGAQYRESSSYNDVKFPNESFLQFGHCEDQKALEGYLSSEWDYIGLDELSALGKDTDDTLDKFTKLSAAARTTIDKPYVPLVRACSNPLGPGAAMMKAWFIDREVDYSEFPDYRPDDFESTFWDLDANKYVGKEYYQKLKNLPEHVRRAWLHGEFVMEGAYFSDFRRQRDGLPWHVIGTMPTWRGARLEDLPWVSIYRAVDWGYFPDPAVCLWIAVLPDHRSIVFKEMSWTRTLAADVAKEIKRQSAGMKIVETFCDPTMFVKTGTIEYSIGDIFEQNGIPLSPAQNDRELYGYAVHDALNTIINLGDDHGDADEIGQQIGQIVPKLQIYEFGAVNGRNDLIRTFPILQMDKLDPCKIGNGDDHWVVALAYFCMGKAMPHRDPVAGEYQRWRMPKRKSRMVSGYVV